MTYRGLQDNSQTLYVKSQYTNHEEVLIEMVY